MTLVKIASRDQMPVLSPWLSAEPGNRTPVERRWMWGATASTTMVQVPKHYPRRLDGPVWNVEPRLRLSTSYLGATTTTPDSTNATFQFGWSEDGRHWILFGYDETDMADIKMMKEFPALLRAAVEDPGLVVVGDGPEAMLTRAALDDMRRAWKALEP